MPSPLPRAGCFCSCCPRSCSIAEDAAPTSSSCKRFLRVEEHSPVALVRAINADLSLSNQSVTRESFASPDKMIGGGETNIYHQPFKAKNKIYPTIPPPAAPWRSPVHAGVGNKGEQVKAEFNKVFEPLLSSGNHRSSQFHEPNPVPMDRLVHTSAPSHKQQEALNLGIHWTHVQSDPRWDDLCPESPSNLDFLHLHHIVSGVNDSPLHKALFKIMVQLVPKTRKYPATWILIKKIQL